MLTVNQQCIIQATHHVFAPWCVFARTMSGSLIRLKKEPIAVNMSVLVKLVRRPSSASSPNSRGCDDRWTASAGKAHTCMHAAHCVVRTVDEGSHSSILSALTLRRYCCCLVDSDRGQI